MKLLLVTPTTKECNFETLYNEFAYGDIAKIEVFKVQYNGYHNWQLWGTSSDGQSMRDLGTFSGYSSNYNWLLDGTYTK